MLKGYFLVHYTFCLLRHCCQTPSHGYCRCSREGLAPADSNREPAALGWSGHHWHQEANKPPIERSEFFVTRSRFSPRSFYFWGLQCRAGGGSIDQDTHWPGLRSPSTQLRFLRKFKRARIGWVKCSVLVIDFLWGQALEIAFNGNDVADAYRWEMAFINVSAPSTLASIWRHSGPPTGRMQILSTQ